MIREVKKTLWDDRSVHYRNAVAGGPVSVVMVAACEGWVGGLIAGSLWLLVVVLLARIDPWLYPPEEAAEGRRS